MVTPTTTHCDWDPPNYLDYNKTYPGQFQIYGKRIKWLSSRKTETPDQPAPDPFDYRDTNQFYQHTSTKTQIDLEDIWREDNGL